MPGAFRIAGFAIAALSLFIVPAGATSWFLAEGATGSFFTTFVLVGNPNPAAANVTMTFPPSGQRSSPLPCRRQYHP